MHSDTKLKLSHTPLFFLRSPPLLVVVLRSPLSACYPIFNSVQTPHDNRTFNFPLTSRRCCTVQFYRPKLFVSVCHFSFTNRLCFPPFSQLHSLTRFLLSLCPLCSMSNSLCAASFFARTHAHNFLRRSRCASHFLPFFSCSVFAVSLEARMCDDAGVKRSASVYSLSSSHLCPSARSFAPVAD